MKALFSVSLIASAAAFVAFSHANFETVASILFVAGFAVIAFADYARGFRPFRAGSGRRATAAAMPAERLGLAA